MAYVTDERIDIRRFGVDFSVGPAQTNLATDVMLVQALMGYFFYEADDEVLVQVKARGLEKPAVNGRFDRSLHRHILLFQASFKSGFTNLSGEREAAVRLDGVIDPFRARHALSTLSKTTYALDALNRGCSSYDDDDPNHGYRNIPTREDIPPALRGELNLPPRAVARKYQS